MIHVGYLNNRICHDTFAVRYGSGGKEDLEWIVQLSYRNFPGEVLRLAGHSCDLVGLKKGTPVDLDLADDWELKDVRFHIPNGTFPVVPEMSVVDTVLHKGFNCFLKRPCNCSLYSALADVYNYRVRRFELGQVWQHKIRIYKDRLQASELVLVDRPEVSGGAVESYHVEDRANDGS